MSETDAQGIVDIGLAKTELAREPCVVLAYLFGSAARGQADALSDVDFAVLVDRGLSPEARMDVQFRLMGTLAQCSRREVQVILLNEAPPLLAYRVAEEGILIHARDAADHHHFVSWARRVYFDWKPWEDLHTAALLRELREEGLSGRGQRRSRALETARRVHRRLAGTAERHP